MGRFEKSDNGLWK